MDRAALGRLAGTVTATTAATAATAVLDRYDHAAALDRALAPGATHLELEPTAGDSAVLVTPAATA